MDIVSKFGFVDIVMDFCCFFIFLCLGRFRLKKREQIWVRERESVKGKMGRGLECWVERRRWWSNSNEASVRNPGQPILEHRF